MMPPDTPPPNHHMAEVTYTNYKGKTAKRRIIPDKWYFGKTEYHPEDQWLLIAYDVEKQAWRTFAMSGFSEWAQLVEPGVTVHQEFHPVPVPAEGVKLADVIGGKSTMQVKVLNFDADGEWLRKYLSVKRPMALQAMKRLDSDTITIKSFALPRMLLVFGFTIEQLEDEELSAFDRQVDTNDA